MLENDDYDLLNDYDTDTQPNSPTLPKSEASYASRVIYSGATTIKNGLFSVVSIVGGCYTVATVAPKLFIAVVTYAVPAAAVPGVVANTVDASVAVVSYSAGSKATALAAQTTWDIGTGVMSYLFRRETPKKDDESRKSAEITGLKYKIT